MIKPTKPLCAAVNPFDLPLGPFRDTLIAAVAAGVEGLNRKSPPPPPERPIVPRYLPPHLRAVFSAVRDALFESGLMITYDRAEEIAWRIAHEENLEMLP